MRCLFASSKFARKDPIIRIIGLETRPFQPTRRAWANTSAKFDSKDAFSKKTLASGLAFIGRA